MFYSFLKKHYTLLDSHYQEQFDDFPGQIE